MLNHRNYITFVYENNQNSKASLHDGGLKSFTKAKSVLTNDEFK